MTLINVAAHGDELPAGGEFLHLYRGMLEFGLARVGAAGRAGERVDGPDWQHNHEAENNQEVLPLDESSQVIEPLPQACGCCPWLRLRVKSRHARLLVS
jgi:hypothetical protein